MVEERLITSEEEETWDVERELAKCFDLLKIPEDIKTTVAEMDTSPEQARYFRCIKVQMICVLNTKGHVAAATWLHKRLNGGPTVLLPTGGPLELYCRYLKEELTIEIRGRVRALLDVGNKEEAEKLLDESNVGNVGADSAKYFTYIIE